MDLTVRIKYLLAPAAISLVLIANSVHHCSCDVSAAAQEKETENAKQGAWANLQPRSRYLTTGTWTE